MSTKASPRPDEPPYIVSPVLLRQIGTWQIRVGKRARRWKIQIKVNLAQVSNHQPHLVLCRFLISLQTFHFSYLCQRPAFRIAHPWPETAVPRGGCCTGSRGAWWGRGRRLCPCRWRRCQPRSAEPSTKIHPSTFCSQFGSWNFLKL